MSARQAAAAIARVPCRWMKRIALLIAFFVVFEAASAATFDIGDAETVYTKKQRSSAGGSSWPDGSLGAIYNGDGTYDFYGANSSKIAYTTGTLDDPGATKQSAKVTGVPKGFSYLAGGPVFEDPYSGARLMIYHAEDGGKGKSFYSVLGMAISTDPAGQEFRDLGVIVRSNLPAGNAEMGGGSFAIVNGYMNVYFSDFMADGNINFVAVARASMADVITNALQGKGTTFNKYYNGAWNEPGLGGRSTAIETGNPASSWLGVSYNTYLNEVVMVNSQWSDDGGDLYITSSSDGVHFTPRQSLAVDPGEQYYPSIIGIGSGPQQSGQTFYAYYTDSQKGAWGRWGDAELRRREITITSPPGEGTGANPLGYTADWVHIGSFQDDFQSGTPANGWKYAWDPKGKVGKQSAYVPLVWSNTAQGYNTTGGATTVPNPKTHNDDFLILTGDGGHPGQSKYMPIAGYTIQADDGAGFYRLTDSSIQLVGGIPQAKDDGLQVLVYVNDTLIGDPQSVLPGSGLTNFDRTLGSLNVGDTIWVMVDPLKSNNNDYFVNFDFSIEKLVFYAQTAFAGAPSFSAVPEPSAAALLLVALAAHRRRRRRS